MPTIIDNIELDGTNVEFTYASDFVEHTDKLVYLTGKAGTGKTTFLKYLRQTTKKKSVTLAPTGVAAINAGGQTIHSFFQLPFGPFVINDKRLRMRKVLDDIDETTIYSIFRYREDKRKIIENLELLIIDEISMVRCDCLDVIDRILRVFRGKLLEPFGGVQVILIGDTFQLPPIADFEQWEILKGYYESPFFFSSKVVTENKPIYIELKKIYRQKEQEFINLLNKIRVNQISEVELNKLNEKYNPTFFSNGSNNHIILSTTNSQVDQTNNTKLEQLTSELKSFAGEITGTFPKDSKGNYVLPTELNLHLKVGAQVMVLKNDTGEFKQYFNGKIGKISSLEDRKVIVEFSNQSKVQIEKASWNNVQYTWNKENEKIEEKIAGTFTQYPLRLAWAITVHKSQGLTFENVFADLGAAFEDGQVYVALSRCTSYNGLVLKSQIHRSRIRTNSKVIEFAKSETPSTLIVQELNSGKADYYYKQVRDEIKRFNYTDAYDIFIKAIKFRNDIETDLFKRYFITTANKIGSFRKNHPALVTKLETKTLENEELKVSIVELELGKISQLTKINDQNNAIKVLLDKVQDVENRNVKLKCEIEILTTDKADLEKAIHMFQTTDRENKTTISRIETIVKRNEQEIERLRSIKWYQKLLGRK